MVVMFLHPLQKFRLHVEKYLEATSVLNLMVMTCI